MAQQVVVPGSGRRHRGSFPSALRADRVGVTALVWLANALGVSVEEGEFVGGYDVDAERVRYPSMRVIVPADWARTGSAASARTASQLAANQLSGAEHLLGIRAFAEFCLPPHLF